MAFVLIIAGAVLLTAAVRNTQQGLFYLVQGDFTGANNFIYWVVSILIVGAIGYIPKAKPASDGFLVLILLVLFLKKDSGFFDMFQKQIDATGQSAASLRQTAINLNNSLSPIAIQLPGSIGGTTRGIPR
jgi:hypothetical protein